MRILVIQETDWIKRGPHQQHHLMDRMALRGHEIHVIDHDYFWREGDPHPIIAPRTEIHRAHKVFEDADITLIRPGILRLNGVVTLSEIYFHLKAIREQIRVFKPDIIVAFGILNAYLGLTQAKRHDIPFVYYLIDHLHTLLPYAVMRQTAKQIEKLTIRSADNILVINQGLKDYVIGMGSAPDKVTVLGAGIDHGVFNPHVDGTSVRHRYGFCENDIVLFFMGFLYNFSGLKEVAESINNTGNEHIRLLVVGDGDLYKPLKAWNEQNGNGHIVLTGKIAFSEVPQHIAAADICLLPAHRNATMMNIVPIKMYEYMGMAKPVIATRLPGIFKEFREGNGVVYVDEPEDVLKRVGELVAAGQIESEGERALNYTKNKDWNSIVAVFEATLQDMI